jgi:hypothetical protein
MNANTVTQRLRHPGRSTAPAYDAPISRKSLPTEITIYLLDEDSSALEITSRLLLSAGYQVKPFRHPDEFFECFRIRCPQFAIVNFSGVNAIGPAVLRACESFLQQLRYDAVKSSLSLGAETALRQ